jgi:hypothetical protein
VSRGTPGGEVNLKAEAQGLRLDSLENKTSLNSLGPAEAGANPLRENYWKGAEAQGAWSASSGQVASALTPLAPKKDAGETKTSERKLRTLGNELRSTLVSHQTRLRADSTIVLNGKVCDVGEIPRSGEVSLMDEELVNKLFNTVSRYFQVGRGDSKDTVRELIREAIESSDTNYGVAEAIEWGAGFVWDQEKVDNDLRLLKEADWDFIVAARRKLELLADDRLSFERVMALRADNPEIEKLLALAEGMLVPLPTNFIPNGKDTDGAFTDAYAAVSCAVDKMLNEIHEEGLGFIFDTPIANDIDGLHKAKESWVTKKKKVQGRPVCNMTFCPGMSLNTDETKQAAKELWGEIVHPTITDIIIMILEYWDKVRVLEPDAVWEDLVIWKMDLKGAYTLLSFRPENAALFAVDLANNKTFISLCGVFGWAPIPFAFQVVTRAITWELKFVLLGVNCMYVDDIMGCCLRKHLQHDLAAASRVCIGLLGRKALATDKTEWGDILDFIGWEISLRGRYVTIARKNLLNAFFCFR